MSCRSLVGIVRLAKYCRFLLPAPSGHRFVEISRLELPVVQGRFRSVSPTRRRQRDKQGRRSPPSIRRFSRTISPM